MRSVPKRIHPVLTNPTPEELLSSMEVYHENSKFCPSDLETVARIAVVNSAPDICQLISRPFVNYPGHPVVPLPKDLPSGNVSFETIAMSRRSEHKFSGKSISLESLAKLLFLGDGIVKHMVVEEGISFALRTAPSAGGLYPVETYCFSLRVNDLPAGSYFYNPLQPQLELLKQENCSTALAEATNLKSELQAAAACIVLAGVLPRNSFKYGQRAYRFLLLEAGHIGQNVLLAAESLGLGGLPVGGFLDDRINRLLSLDGCNEFAIYILLVGHKAN